MNFNFKNLSENTKRIRIIPKNGTELVANIGVDNPTAMIDEDGVFSVCLSPNETPTINCDDSPSSIILPLTGGAYYEIVDGGTIYDGGLIRHLIVGGRDATYFEGLRFEVVTGTNIDPTTVRIVNLTDNAKRIKFTVIDAATLDEYTFNSRNLNYAETVLAHNVVSVDDGFVFEFCLGVGGDDDEIPFDEMHFTTTDGTIGYFGEVGDQMLLSDGTIVTLDEGELYDFLVPAGKHKVVLKEPRESGGVGLFGEALIELHNFPTLSTITYFVFSFQDNSSPNLVKVPTVLPSNFTKTSWMFQDATSFNQDISSWNVSNVTDMFQMFYNAQSFNQDISSWNVSNVINMGNMFCEAQSFNQDISSWDVSNVTDMDGMFQDAISFNQDLSQWCVSNITSKPFYFDYNAPLFTEDKHPLWGTCPQGNDNGDTNWDIEYVLNGTTYREVTGNPIPYQHMWKDPERFSTSLVINNTVTVVGQQAFRGWINAVSLTIGDSVQVIHPQAFQYWEALQYLTIPASVTEIWEEAFSGAKSLISITVLAVNPPDLRNVNAFWQNSLTEANIYVPVESVGAYKAAPNWSAYANNIFPIPS